MLKLAYQRNEATPAMRLLDDVLDILGDASGKSDDDPFAAVTAAASASVGGERANVAGVYLQRRNEAASRMQSAFTGGAPAGIDIFAAAAALAEAGALAAEELSVEYVRLYDFLGETSELLEQARQQQQELGEAIERTQKEVEYVEKRQPGLLATDRALMERVRQLQLARIAFEERELSIAQLDDVMYLARSFEVQNLREGAGLEF